MGAFAATSVAQTGEDWKGKSDGAQLHLGGLTGMGVLDSQAGYTVLGTASKVLASEGFIGDINDSVSLEAALGPLFVLSSAAFTYSVHLRWDFRKDEHWTFYGLGGLAGNITGSSLGDRFILLPRFGVGTFYHFNERVAIRGEISRELIAAGVIFPL